MEALQLRHLSEPESILLAILTYIVYVPEVPFMTGHFTQWLGCDLTAMLMIIYFVGSLTVMVTRDVANGLLHTFAAALGWATNHLVCAPADHASLVLQDMALLARPAKK